MNDGKALWRAIAAQPGEDTPKLALADWYAERRDLVMYHALRWCVARKKWPKTVRPDMHRWARQTTTPGRGSLPACLFDLMPPAGIVPMWNYYASVRAAIRALAVVLAKAMAACEVPT